MKLAEGEKRRKKFNNKRVILKENINYFSIKIKRTAKFIT